MESDNIRILGYDFVKNNKNKGKLIINNCSKIKEFSFSDDTRFIDDKGPHLLEEYNDYDNDIYSDFYENSPDNCSEHSLYKNIKTDDIYSNCSEIKNNTKMEEKYNNSTINYIIDKIIIYQHNYYSNISYMFFNCSSLSSLPDISKWNIRQKLMKH